MPQKVKLADFVKVDDAYQMDAVPLDMACIRKQARKVKDPKDRLAFLRDFLRTVPEDNFNMSEWRGTIADAAVPEERQKTGAVCGTVACIGGWTELVFNINRKAVKTLGLTEEEAERLFYPEVGQLCWDELTNEQAAQVIDYFLSTGLIDWKRVLTPQQRADAENLGDDF